jgi:hypothetical protein
MLDVLVKGDSQRTGSTLRPGGSGVIHDPKVVFSTCRLRLYSSHCIGLCLPLRPSSPPNNLNGPREKRRAVIQLLENNDNFDRVVAPPMVLYLEADVDGLLKKNYDTFARKQ